MQPAKTRLTSELCEKIREQILGCEAAIVPDANLFEAGLDSMGIMRLIVLVEEDYGYNIPDSAITEDNFRTVESIVAYIEENPK